MGLQVYYPNCPKKFNGRAGLDRHKEHCKPRHDQNRIIHPLQPVRTVQRRIHSLRKHSLNYHLGSSTKTFDVQGVPNDDVLTTDFGFEETPSPSECMPDTSEIILNLPRKSNDVATVTTTTPSSGARIKTFSDAAVAIEIRFSEQLAQSRFGARAGRPVGAPLYPERGHQRQTCLPFGQIQARIDDGEQPRLTGRDFRPFSNAREYAFAKWAIKNFVSKGAIDQLLRDPDMEFARTGMSFKSADDIYKRIEAIPYGIRSDHWREQLLVTSSAHTGGTPRTYKAYRSYCYSYSSLIADAHEGPRPNPSIGRNTRRHRKTGCLYE